MSDPNQACKNVFWTTPQELASCDAPRVGPTSKCSPDELLARSRNIEARSGFNVELPCQQQLKISIFFDGTGNNRDEDEPLNKSSNIARLFRAHDFEKATRIYVPGIGTPFPEIGEKDYSDFAQATGKGGEARIEFAMKEFGLALSKAEARARNPTNKIAGIHVAIFGFSRGAAQARAFALRLHQRLAPSAEGWILTGKGYPVRVYFMGLFDTVASVGITNATRRTSTTAVGVTTTESVLGLLPPVIVAKMVGAVPIRMDREGHNDWATDLRIPSSVVKCVHYVAAHEVRQSFPLDTVRVNAPKGEAFSSMYPSQCREVVYPGMHANVGGGYAPGEHGRAAALDEQLALIPLLHMYRDAIDAGVPLLPIKDMPPEFQPLFQLDPDEQCLSRLSSDNKSQKKLRNLFYHYMEVVKPSGCVEEQMAQHLYWLYRWRRLRVGNGDVDSYEKRMLEEREANRRKLAEEETRARNEMHSRMARDPQVSLSPYAGYSVEAGVQVDPKVQKLREKLETQQKVYDQIPKEDQRFIEKMYSAWLKWVRDEPLTLHEQKLAEAYSAPLLDDQQVIDFFDNQVHDSVADFRSGGAGYVDMSLVGEPRDVFPGPGPWPISSEEAAMRVVMAGSGKPAAGASAKQAPIRLKEVGVTARQAGSSEEAARRVMAGIDERSAWIPPGKPEPIRMKDVAVNAQRQKERLSNPIEEVTATAQRQKDQVMRPIEEVVGMGQRQSERLSNPVGGVVDAARKELPDLGGIGSHDDLLSGSLLPDGQQIKQRAAEQVSKQVKIPGGL